MHTEMSNENSSQSVITRLQIGGVHLTEEKKVSIIEDMK